MTIIIAENRKKFLAKGSGSAGQQDCEKGFSRQLRQSLFGLFGLFFVGATIAEPAPEPQAKPPPLTLGAWVKLPAIPAAFYIHTSAVYKDYLYVLGGGGGPYVFYTKLNPDGSIGPWQRGTSLPANAAYNYMKAVVHNGRIYAVGGSAKVAEDNGSVWFAEIKADGNLGDWQKTTTASNKLHSGAAAVAVNHLYYAGGFYSRRIYAAPIAADGTLGEWQEMPHFISPRGGFDLFVIRDVLYGPGGNSGHTADTVKDTVFRTQIQADGMLKPWKRDTSLPVPVASYAGTQVDDVILLFGGVTTEGRTAQAWCAKAGPDGMLGDWCALPPLPRPIDNFAAATAGNGWVYITGGFITREDGERGVSNEVYAAPVLRSEAKSGRP